MKWNGIVGNISTKSLISNFISINGNFIGINGNFFESKKE